MSQRRSTPTGNILSRGQVSAILGGFMATLALDYFLLHSGRMLRIFSGAIREWARRLEWGKGSTSSRANMECNFFWDAFPLVFVGISGAIIAADISEQLWTEWSIHILIVLSFLLQVFLLIFVGIRRRSASAEICLGLAYKLAEYVAVYPLGRMSFYSMPHVDPLVIFWVPFLLLHLGGHDTLTAYSLEDNQVSLGRVLTLIVHLSGGAYILYLYIAGTARILASATILMFVVGVVKYVERVWALKCANIENLGTSLDIALTVDAEGVYGSLDRRGHLDAEEEVLLGAHYLFSYCKSELVDCQATVAAFTAATAIEQGSRFNGKMYIYELVEMELSLMYDFLYTKVPVIYTWHGCFIRVVSLLGTMASFLLFLIGGHGAYSRVNVFITYFLLVGAVVLEMASLLRALCSTWTCALLHARNWDQIHVVFVRLRRLVKAASNRRWLHSIGQHSLLDFCSGGKNEGTHMIINAVGLKDWWNKQFYSSTITIPPGVKEAIMEKIVQTMRQCHRAGLDIKDMRGRAVLTNSKIFDDIDRIFKDKSFDECILIWHIATEIYLCSCDRRNEEEPFVEAMELLSNYMGFLLMVRPELLPSGVSRSLYPDICSGLEKEWHELSTEKVEHGIRDSPGEEKDRTGISTRQEEDTSKQSTGQVEDRRRQSTGEMEDESTGHVEVAINTPNGDMESENEIREVERENEIREVEHENEISEVEDGNEIREVEHENQIREVKRENEIREVEHENEIREVEDGSKIKEVEHKNEIREVEDGNEIIEVKHKSQIKEGNIISTEKEENGNHKHSKLTERQELANHLLYKYNNSRYPTAYHKGSHLASRLLRNEWNIPNVPEVIFAVWVEYLCYAAYHVTGVSHCRQLANGGDFLTVIRLVIAHVELFELDRQDIADNIEA